MSELQDILRAAKDRQTPGVLATLVRVKGSSYRRPGARMLMDPEGPRAGVVSAGCLEADLVARCSAVMEEGVSSVASYELGSDLDMVWGTAMGCEGRAEVLLEPISPAEIPPWMADVDALQTRRGSGVLATVFAIRGLVPYHVGDRVLFEDGTAAGPLAALAQEIQAKGYGESRTVAFPEGEADVLFEPLKPAFALWIFGAGEAAKPLAHFAKTLGWVVTVADHRPALATAKRFPGVHQFVVGPPEQTLKNLHLDARSAALVVSHVYDKDREALASFLASGAGYVGLQGSRRRCAQLLGELEAKGLTLSPSVRERFFMPAGLDLGAESPEAIALAMISEIQAVLLGREVMHLRNRQGSIH